MNGSDWYTTGEAARICRTSLQSIIRNCDAGKLTCHRVPGSRHRRITRERLTAFMRENQIPTDLLPGSGGPMRVHLEATTKMVELDGVPARVWEGTTGLGVPVHCYITRVAVRGDLEQLEFESLTACRPPSEEVAYLPERMAL